MYSLNLISCLILLALGSIYVLTKPLSIGNKIPSESNGLAIPDKIFLDDIALALVQNFDESSSSDEEGLIFDEGNVPADTDSSNVAGAGASTNSSSTSSGSGNGSIIGSQIKVNGASSATGNTSSKSGVVTGPDGTSTSIANTHVDDKGNVVDSKGNVIAKVDKNGNVVDNKGNTVAKVDKDGNVIDNNNNVVATVSKNGNVTPIVPFAVGTGNGSNTNANGSNGNANNAANNNSSNSNGVANGNNSNGNGANGNSNNGSNSVNEANSSTNYTDSKGGVVTGPDGNSIDISNSTIDKNGNVVDNKGNTVGKVEDNGNIVDNKGNTVGKVDSNGNVVDNNGNTVAKVDNDGKVTATAPTNNNPDKVSDTIESNPREVKNKKRGGFLYVLLPALALIGGAGAFLYKRKYVDDIIGAPAETVTEMNNIGAAPAAASTTTTTATNRNYGEKRPATTFSTNNISPKNATGAAMKNVDVGSTALPAVETGPSMESIIKEVETVEPRDASILPAVLAAGAVASTANREPVESSSRNYKTNNNVPTKTLNNVKSSPITTTTSKNYTAPIAATGAPYETTETVYETRYGPNKSKYLLGAAPVAAVGAALASKKNNNEKNVKAVPVAKNNEEIVEEYIVEHNTPKNKSVNRDAKAPVPAPVPAKEEIIEEYVIERSKSPKKTSKTIYKTIYKNGVPVQVPITGEEENKDRDVAVVGGENPYKSMIPTIIETIVRHSLPLGDNAEETKKADYEKLFALANIPVPSESTQTREIDENNKPNNTTKKTVYKTIFKNGLPIQVPAEEEEVEEEIPKAALIKSPKLKGIKKRITTYVTKDGKQVEVPVTEEFSLNPKDVQGEIPSEYSTEEFGVPSNKATKQKTIKKYITVYKTTYKNGKPEEVVENIEVPEGKTPEEVLASLPRDAQIKKPEEEPVIEKRFVNPTVIETPVKEEIIEERTVKPTIVKSPKVHSVKKYVTTYKTTYKNGVPVEESIETEDLPNEPITETTYASGEPATEVSNVNGPKTKTIKKITTYKTIYKNGKPVEVIEEVPEEVVIQANPVIVSQTKDVVVPNEENTDETVGKEPVLVKGLVSKSKEPEEEIEEIIEEYEIGADPKNVKKTIYRNGVPVTEESESKTVPSESFETEEIVEIPEDNTRGISEITSALTGGSNPYMKMAPYIIKKIVKYAIPGSDNNSENDLGELMTMFNGITREAPESPEVVEVSEEAEQREVEVPKPEESQPEEPLEKQPEQPETTDRDLTSSLVSAAIGQGSNPYMKMAPYIIKKIVKYAIPGSDNNSENDLGELMTMFNGITREAPEEAEQRVVEAPKPQEETQREVEVPKPEEEYEEIIEEYEMVEEGADPKSAKRTVYRNGVQITEDIETKLAPFEGEETEEIIEEYEIEDGAQKTIKRTILKNGVEVPDDNTRGISDITSALTGGSNPYMKMAPFIINKIVKYAIPGNNNDSKTDLGELMDMMKLIGGNREVVEETIVEEKPKISIPSNKERDVDEFSEALPSIIEEDESLPMENNRSIETTSPTESKKFEKRSLPKRSSSKRLSLELKAAVAAEIAKLESEINDETKNIPRPRKQSISQGNKQSLGRKESIQSIKAVAEGCLVRKPSIASSIKSNHSITEEWSGPVFEKKVFEVVVEHTPQLPDEVKLNLGDLVEVKQVFEDGWAYGINTATKVDGTFPVNCLGEEREPNKNGRYVPRLIRVYQAREEAGKKELEDEEKFKHELTEFAKKKKEYKLKKQQRKMAKQ